MIFEPFIAIFVTLITGIFAILPDIPSFDQDIINILDYIKTLIITPAQFLARIYGPVLWPFVLLSAITIFTAEHLYNVAFWVIKKIPIINIK